MWTQVFQSSIAYWCDESTTGGYAEIAKKPLVISGLNGIQWKCIILSYAMKNTFTNNKSSKFPDSYRIRKVFSIIQCKSDYCLDNF